MHWLGMLRRRVAALWCRDRFDRDLEEEMQSHLQNAAEENAENGMPAEEAWYAARRRFGNGLAWQEASREAWSWRWLDDLVQDLAYGVRMCRRSPGFTAVVVLTLALGIGATTAIFTVVNGVLLRPLPYPEPDRLIYITHKVGDRPASPFAYTRDYAEWRRHNRTLSEIAGYLSFDANLAGQGDPERVSCGLATESLFSVLGVRPFLGRVFLPEEDRPGGPSVAILEHAFWRRRFNSDPAVIGKIVALDGKSYNIVGVLPATFRIPDRFTTHYDLWVPFAISDTGNARQLLVQVIGRLKSGVTIAAARGDLDSLTRTQLRRGWKYTAVVIPWHEQIVAKTRRSLLLVLGAVGFLLMIVCVNVANLLLSRGAGRGQEIAVRRAMGAGRTRIIRQLLTESVLMSVMGGTLGLALARVCKDLLLAFISPNLPTLAPIALDYGVLLFSLGIVVLTGIGFGLAPALQASGMAVNESLKEAGRASTEGRSSRQGRNILAVAEVALALVLLCGAGLLFKSFLRLRGVDPGFRVDRVLSFGLNLTPSRYPKPTDQTRFLQDLLGRVKGLPGVESVAGGICLPLSGASSGYDLTIEGHPGEAFDVSGASVSADYFVAMGIPLFAGRTFQDADREGAPGVVMVNQSFARRFLPNESPLGKRISDPYKENNWLTVVGVVGDVRPDPEREASPEIYLSYLQPNDRITWPGGAFPFTVVVRSTADLRALVPAIRTQIAVIDSTQPPHDFVTLEDRRTKSIAPRRVNMLLIASFAALALVLGAIGIYGVLSYSVAQRTHEIGVRMALGAQPDLILAMVLRKGMALLAMGVAIGLLASLGLTRLIASELWGVTATDPWTYAAVIVVLTATGAAACWIPARRATKVDPLSAIRYQ